MIFESPRYLSFVRSLAVDEAVRLQILVFSVYLDPSSNGVDIFDYGVDGTPDTRYAYDGEFHLDFFVLSPGTIVLINANRAQRMPR